MPQVSQLPDVGLRPQVVGLELPGINRGNPAFDLAPRSQSAVPRVRLRSSVSVLAPRVWSPRVYLKLHEDPSRGVS